MVRRPQPLPSAPERTPEHIRRSVERLNARISELEGFNPDVVTNRNDPTIDSIEQGIEETLSRVFGHRTPDYLRYRQAATLDTAPHNYAYEVPRAQIVEGLRQGKARAIALLQRAIQGLQEDLGVEEETSPEASERDYPRKAFVVHGHDEGAREAVARFLERLNFEPIILHERANQGRTIIEKIEAHSEVGFAVVLLTPDDVGGTDPDHLNPRARQNVLLELGYFVGLLGRHRVCALKRGEIELPSDFGGVVWTPFDNSEGWKRQLGTELEAAGFGIDWNLVMRR